MRLRDDDERQEWAIACWLADKSYYPSRAQRRTWQHRLARQRLLECRRREALRAWPPAWLARREAPDRTAELGLQADVLAAMDLLTSDERYVVCTVFWAGLPARQAGRHIGLTQGAAYGAYHRGLQKLKRALRAYAPAA